MFRKNWPMVPLVTLVLLASGVALAESYHGIRNWALMHGVDPGWAADAWPLQVDLFIIAGDLGLILSAFYAWPYRVRVLSWYSVGLGLGVSVLCNSFQDVWVLSPVAIHLTKALPPISATAGLMIVLSVVKQYAARADARAPELAPAKVRTLRPVPDPRPKLVPSPPVYSGAALTVVPDSVVPNATGTGTSQEERWRTSPRYTQGMRYCREHDDAGTYLSQAKLAELMGLKNKTLAGFILREYKASQNGSAVHVP